jgi:hypothetical protein
MPGIVAPSCTSSSDVGFPWDGGRFSGQDLMPTSLFQTMARPVFPYYALRLVMRRRGAVRTPSSAREGHTVAGVIEAWLGSATYRR